MNTMFHQNFWLRNQVRHIFLFEKDMNSSAIGWKLKYYNKENLKFWFINHKTDGAWKKHIKEPQLIYWARDGAALNELRKSDGTQWQLAEVVND